MSVVEPPRFTQYFLATRQRPDRSGIEMAWIHHAVSQPARQQVQEDGRIRRWAQIDAAEGRYLRVVLLPDGVTIHNAFFDRDFVP